MQRGHHHAVDFGPDSKATHRAHRSSGGAPGSSKSALARFLQERFLIVLVILSVPFMYLVARSLRRGQLHDIYPDNVMDLPTCPERLAALGLDFGDSGSMRLAVSKWALDRRRVYDAMGSGVHTQGLALGGVVTQGLRQHDLFRYSSDSRSGQLLISPLLHGLEVPVRAMVLPLRDSVAAGRIRDAMRALLLPAVAAGSIWLQDDALYHATLYHASSHAKPIHASAAVVAEEERAIKGVCGSTCPINAVLDRVIITATGVVVACWQVLPTGGEPALLREALGRALPNAPPREAQMVKEPAMLHTTIARLLQPPAELAEAASALDKQGANGSTSSSSGGSGAGGGVGVDEGAGGGRELRAEGLEAGGSQRRLLGDTGGGEGGGAGGKGTGPRVGRAVVAVGEGQGPLDAEVVVAAVDALSGMLCGLRAQFGEVWFIEEQDLLALALDGRYVKHLAPLRCPAAGAGVGAAAAA